MFIPGLPKGLKNQLSNKLEESFDMYVDKAISLYKESSCEQSFPEWWETYKVAKAKLKEEQKKEKKKK